MVVEVKLFQGHWCPYSLECLGPKVYMNDICYALCIIHPSLGLENADFKRYYIRSHSGRRQNVKCGHNDGGQGGLRI